jgi:SAM-dependent methyltransferase
MADSDGTHHRSPPDPSATGFVDHFSKGAEGYARFRPTYPPEFVDRLVATLTGSMVDRTAAVVWESGCGSGQLTRALAGRFQRVVATDASPAQLARAPRLEGVGYHVALAEASAIRDGTIALAVAGQAAHWFDLPAYYAEIRRVTRPGAGVVLATYSAPSIEGPPGEVLRGFLRILEPHWPPERRFVEDGYGSLPFPFEETVQPPLQLSHEWTLEEVVGYVRSWSAVARATATVGTAVIERFDAELREAWRDRPRQTIRWTLSTRIGRT